MAKAIFEIPSTNLLNSNNTVSSINPSSKVIFIPLAKPTIRTILTKSPAPFAKISIPSFSPFLNKIIKIIPNKKHSSHFFKPPP